MPTERLGARRVRGPVSVVLAVVTLLAALLLAGCGGEQPAAAEQQAYLQAVAALADRVRAGDGLVLHCAAGIGRTGTTAACLLKRLGLPTVQALQRVRQAGSDPESALQRGLIDQL